MQQLQREKAPMWRTIKNLAPTLIGCSIIIVQGKSLSSMKERNVILLIVRFSMLIPSKQSSLEMNLFSFFPKNHSLPFVFLRTELTDFLNDYFLSRTDQIVSNIPGIDAEIGLSQNDASLDVFGTI